MRDPIAISMAAFAMAGVGLLWHRAMLWRKQAAEAVATLRKQLDEEQAIRDGLLEATLEGMPEKFARAMTRRLEREALGLTRPARGDGRN